MIKILVIEDDQNILKMIEATLSIGSYGCDLCSDGNAAIDMIKENVYDVILLDVMLPGCDGFEIINHIDTDVTPVIFLTALQDVSDKVRGLRLGAEDYIVKPFEPVELLARIEVVLRRYKKSSSNYSYKDINVDIDRHIITKNGKQVQLTPKEFEVFVFFLQNLDIALTRERLLYSVWGYEYIGETRTVDTHVQQIRKKLGLQDSLVTIPKLGYRLEKI